MNTKSTSSQADGLGAERILRCLGYDPELLGMISEKHRGTLRAAAVAWLVACLILGAAAGYAAWMVMPGRVAPIVGGGAIFLLTLNLLRVVNGGGGSALLGTAEASRDASAHYRPSIVPALVFALLAGILAQPAQIPFWSDLGPQVEEHRQELIAQHSVAAAQLGTDAEYYRQELLEAGFPIFRLKLVWGDPKRAIRLTLVVLALVLLPAFWSQVFALKSIRAYEAARNRRTRVRVVLANDASTREIRTILTSWPTFRPASAALSHRKSI